MAARGDALLETYRKKRDFSKTQEPSGSEAPSKAADGLFFCVQKHDATRLHYDFRIEWEGVLKSWAVTRGPSLDPADKRLAVRTEDHPMDYGTFEGTIPKGEYGGGTVMLWDQGTWEPLEDAEEGLAKGNLKMRILGERMNGNWALIRMKPRPGEKRENWLLIKEKDDAVDRRRNLLSADTSIKTGRTMAAIAKGDDVWDNSRDDDQAAESAPKPAAKGRKNAAAAKPATAAKPAKSAAAPKKKPAGKTLPLPRFVAPQLATLVDEAPDGRDWLHEMKYDGYRVMIAVGGGEVRCFTRNEKDWTDRFAPIAEAARALDCRNALIDGEIVAFDANGGTDFSTLQAHLSDGGSLSCFCFDLLTLDGADLTKRPLTERKAMLRDLIERTGSDVLLYSDHVTGNGPAVHDNICRAGHEGIVAKRADAPYRSGRTRSWLKVKCSRRQEFVIGGWRTSDKRGRPFASILLGVMEDGKLAYRGRVGSGFDEANMADLAERFAAHKRMTSPFIALPTDARRGSRFVEPVLVAEIEFAEITADGSIRHGVFKGLREDKEAGDVVDEHPQREGKAASAKRRAGKAAAKADTPELGQAPDSVAGVRLTHPERVVFAGQGVTKGDLALYYEKVADRMLAHAGGRPLSLVRCPQGGQKRCFFQKHDTGGFPEAVKTVPIPEKDGGIEHYLTVSDAAGLVGAVQMNTLEFHIWGSRNDRLEKPDRLIFDLDPDESLGFEDVKAASFDLRDRLAELGLKSFPMVTGGKGVHVVVPLDRRQGWEEVKAFAKAFAVRQAEDEPDRFVATMSKAKRKGRIFIDWLRNERGSTAIAPYSSRSREGAPVATPVSWNELATLSAANGFDINTVVARLDEPDPWADYADVRQSLTKKIRDKFGA
ncbi:DNA ligase D [Aurantimonas sp. HBX-1]|uniref:DNA ligase D n=1 Tax=Aurantimonas sp. HBX-1 TaxID=2906072 RepID=UPI001F28CBE0|nr:DNA ligase D [Aurantimonas sp. HBX-1]UIJ70576.1 DNA ligase D [Aurantimonas sp. HBX-1]